MSGNNGSAKTAIGHIQAASNSSVMAFYTEQAGTMAERMRIREDGLVSVAVGIELGSGLDGTAANTLNDYEEGTWTISLANVSGLLDSGTSAHNVYTKIGRVVHVDGYFDFSSDSSDTDAIAIDGLPFTIKTNTYSSGSQINARGSGSSMSTFAVSGQTFLHLYTNDNGNTGFGQMKYDSVGRMGMHFSITYITDQ